MFDKQRVIITDLHLTLDAEYKFDFLRYVEKLGRNKRGKKASLYILGDVTDAKNRHDALLVNRVINALVALSKVYERVVVLVGNHDYVNPDCPFFQFSSFVDNVYFVTRPEVIENCLFVPHTSACDKNLNLKRFRGKVDYVFTHWTFTGSIAESGVPLTSSDDSFEKKLLHVGARRIFSGDIHRPQRLRRITYVGSPYHNRVGDDYTPRFMVQRYDGVFVSVPYTRAPMFHKVRLSRTGLVLRNRETPAPKEGDFMQFDVAFALYRKKSHEFWTNLVERYCARYGWVYKGLTVSYNENLVYNVEQGEGASRTFFEWIDEYCKEHGKGDASRKFARQIIKESERSAK